MAIIVCSASQGHESHGHEAAASPEHGHKAHEAAHRESKAEWKSVSFSVVDSVS